MNVQKAIMVRLLRSACFVFAFAVTSAFLPAGQATTLEFTFTNNVLARWLPWQEQGFTVANTTPSNYFPISYPIIGDDSVWVAAIDRNGDMLASAGLSFSGGNRTMTAAIITNDAALPFDLLSLEVVKLSMLTSPNPAVNNYARIISSAGGSFDLLGTPDGTTLSFSGGEWENLSYLKIEYLSYGVYGFSDQRNPARHSSELLLDNLVLQPIAVPEPSALGLFALVGSGVLLGKRKASRQQPGLG